MTAESLDLAIIGGGPAGLSAAIEAQRLGLARVAVFEREAEAGGTVRHCGHPGFGMLDFGRLWSGPRYARALRERSLGVDLRLGHAVTGIGSDGVLGISTPDGDAQVRAHRILLATGIREMPRSGRLVSGTRPFGVLTTGALQRFVYLHGRLPCRRPVIVGSELVAFSTILTLRHAGAKPVALLSERHRLDAPWPAGIVARTVFGVPVLRNARLVSIDGRDVVERVFVAIGDRIDEIVCDGVIFTGRWFPEASLLSTSAIDVDPISRGPIVSETLRTSDPRVYAAGNVRFGVRTSGRCALEGRHAARQIVRDLAAATG